ncbi:hypothetical protein E4U32_000639 [Claviceps aff. humidiphila group G2b]|nr:hypothetical protein E4U32_000639 [Claviceps aff. humidiphila group G2b]
MPVAGIVQRIRATWTKANSLPNKLSALHTFIRLLSDSTRYDYGLRFVETRKGRTKRLTDQAFCDECLDASPIHFWFKNEDDAEQMLQLIDGSIQGVTAQFRSLNKEQVEQVPWQDHGPR